MQKKKKNQLMDTLHLFKNKNLVDIHVSTKIWIHMKQGY